MILALRALGIGDLATAVPALRGLRRRYPADELRLAAGAWLAPLVPLIGAVDRLVPADGVTGEPAGPAQWPPPAPRLAVNLHGCGPQSHRLLATARPGALLGFACPAAGHPEGPAWRAQEHEVARWCRLLAWYGIPADREDLRLRVPRSEVAAGLTIVHPGAKSPDRRWPIGRYAAVARELADAGHRVVLTGSVTEQMLASQVAELAGLPASAVLAGRTNLADLAAMVARARLVVCGDTGIAHLATGYGTNSVVLFGPVTPQQWGPPPDRPQHHALYHEGGGVIAITVDEVVSAAVDGAAADRTAADRAAADRTAAGR